MNTNIINATTNTNMPDVSEKEIIAGHQARLKEIKDNNGLYLNDGINPCPVTTYEYNVSIKF